MASGYTVSGRGDLDALFMARQNTPRANVGLRVGGVDLANRYEPIGSASPIAATNFRSGGTDLANLFRDIHQPLASLFTLNAGRLDGPGGYATIGYIRGMHGSISPLTYGGIPIERLNDWFIPGYILFDFWLAQESVPQSFFTSITINGRTFLSSQADAYYSSAGSGVTVWSWTAYDAGLVNSRSYPVQIAPMR